MARRQLSRWLCWAWHTDTPSVRTLCRFADVRQFVQLTYSGETGACSSQPLAERATEQDRKFPAARLRARLARARTLSLSPGLHTCCPACEPCTQSLTRR